MHISTSISQFADMKVKSKTYMDISYMDGYLLIT